MTCLGEAVCVCLDEVFHLAHLKGRKEAQIGLPSRFHEVSPLAPAKKGDAIPPQPLELCPGTDRQRALFPRVVEHIQGGVSGLLYARVVEKGEVLVEGGMGEERTGKPLMLRGKEAYGIPHPFFMVVATVNHGETQERIYALPRRNSTEERPMCLDSVQVIKVTTPRSGWSLYREILHGPRAEVRESEAGHESGRTRS